MHSLVGELIRLTGRYQRRLSSLLHTRPNRRVPHSLPHPLFLLDHVSQLTHSMARKLKTISFFGSQLPLNSFVGRPLFHHPKQSKRAARYSHACDHPYYHQSSSATPRVAWPIAGLATSGLGANCRRCRYQLKSEELILRELAIL